MTEKQYNNDKVYTRKDMEKEKRYYLDIIQKLQNQINMHMQVSLKRREENEKLKTRMEQIEFMCKSIQERCKITN